jgi:leader peptidase (prepilin peptidase)/N-methyltransferase
MAVWLPPLLAAPFIGSFLGVLIHRLPEHRPLLIARSACLACGRTLGVLDLVPIASYLVLRGRCRSCGAPIAGFHLAVEMLAFLAPASAALVDADATSLWVDCLLGWALLALGWIDLRHLILPDAITLPLIVGGLAETWWLEPEAILDHALGAAGGYLFFRTVALAYRALRRREGLGAGDAKLLAAAGAWLGWAALPAVVIVAAFVGLAGAAAAALRGAPLHGTIRLPFGAPLALALWIVRLVAQSQAAAGAVLN